MGSEMCIRDRATTGRHIIFGSQRGVDCPRHHFIGSLRLGLGAAIFAFCRFFVKIDCYAGLDETAYAADRADHGAAVMDHRVIDVDRWVFRSVLLVA